jgi:hypothetical protein
MIQVYHQNDIVSLPLFLIFSPFFLFFFFFFLVVYFCLLTFLFLFIASVYRLARVN